MKTDLHLKLNQEKICKMCGKPVSQQIIDTHSPRFCEACRKQFEQSVKEYEHDRQKR